MSDRNQEALTSLDSARRNGASLVSPFKIDHSFIKNVKENNLVYREVVRRREITRIYKERENKLKLKKKYTADVSVDDYYKKIIFP